MTKQFLHDIVVLHLTAGVNQFLLPVNKSNRELFRDLLDAKVVELITYSTDSDLLTFIEDPDQKVNSFLYKISYELNRR